MKLAIVGDPHGDVSYIEDDIDAVMVTGDLGGSAQVRGQYFQAKQTGNQFEAWNIGDEIFAEADSVVQHYNTLDVPVYVTQGNWDGEPLPDASWSLQELVEPYEQVEYVDGQIADLGSYQVVGYGTDRFNTQPETLDEWDPEEQQFTDGPQQYRQKKTRLESVLTETDAPTILLSHNVPFDSGLDTIDASVPGMYGLPNGSNVVSTLLEDDAASNVILAVGGHIHEGHGQNTVEDIPVINAGQNNVTYVDIRNGRVVEVVLAQ